MSGLEAGEDALRRGDHAANGFCVAVIVIVVDEIGYRTGKERVGKSRGQVICLFSGPGVNVNKWLPAIQTLPGFAQIHMLDRRTLIDLAPKRAGENIVES